MAFEGCGWICQFRGIWFGIINRVSDSSIYNSWINLQGTIADIYNVTVCGPDWPDHNHDLKQFLATVNKQNITLNHDEISCNSTIIRILGYIVGKGIMKPDPEWLKPLRIPNTIANLRMNHEYIRSLFSIYILLFWKKNTPTYGNYQIFFTFFRDLRS